MKRVRGRVQILFKGPAERDQFMAQYANEWGHLLA
jgi:hypothetical protein